MSIDDDVLVAVKEKARRENRTAGQVLSELARQSLTRTAEPAMDGEREVFHGFRPLPHRGRPVTNTLVDELRDEEHE